MYFLYQQLTQIRFVLYSYTFNVRERSSDIWYPKQEVDGGLGSG